MRVKKTALVEDLGRGIEVGKKRDVADTVSREVDSSAHSSMEF